MLMCHKLTKFPAKGFLEMKGIVLQRLSSSGEQGVGNEGSSPCQDSHEQKLKQGPFP